MRYTVGRYHMGDRASWIDTLKKNLVSDIDFLLSNGHTLQEAFKIAKENSCAGPKVWNLVAREFETGNARAFDRAECKKGDKKMKLGICMTSEKGIDLICRQSESCWLAIRRDELGSEKCIGEYDTLEAALNRLAEETAGNFLSAKISFK